MYGVKYKLGEYFVYFIIYSFVGWLIESVLISIINRRLVHRGSMKGPFLLIYGFGAIFILLFLSPFSNNIIVLFLASLILMTIWEYLVHWFLELLYKRKWWDYSFNFLNIHGRVCLFYSLCWGFLGVILIIFLHPFVMKIVNNIQSLSIVAFNFVGYLFIVCFLLDVIFAIPRAIKWEGFRVKQRPDVLTTIIKLFK